MAVKASRRRRTTPRAPTRAEFNQLSARVAHLADAVSDCRKEMDMQIRRMGQLQAEIDLIRAAWSKLRPKAI